MSLLATFRIKKLHREVATLTVATDATHEWANAPSVTKVASVTVASSEKTEAANDGEQTVAVTVSATDRWCWPHSPAMNTTELDTFTARLARFTDKGVDYDAGERLADALMIRDRNGDDRRLCLECPHLQGFGRWRCGNWLAADVAQQGLARDLVLMLQRCDGFT